MTDMTLIQFLLLYGLTIIFTSISFSRQTFIPYLLSGVLWISCGLTSYMLEVSLLSTTMGYISVGLGLIFFLAAIKVLGESVMEAKQSRFGVTV